MRIFRVDIDKPLKDFVLVPVFDVHLGSRFRDTKLWKRLKSYIKENENVYFYIGGDFLEFIPISDKRFQASNYEEDFLQNADRLLNYSIERAVDELWEIRHKCLWAHGGNHESKFYSSFGLDPIAFIANELDVNHFTLEHECIVTLRFLQVRNRKITIYSHHGVGSSQKGGTLLNRVEDLAISFDSDVYIMGHSHQLGFITKPYLTTDTTGKSLIRKERYFLRIGGFRFARVEGVMGYEERMGYRPNGVGTFLLRWKIDLSKPIDSLHPKKDIRFFDSFQLVVESFK